MPEPLSLSICAVGGYAALYAAARRGSAVSPEASSVRQAAIVVMDTTERSQALFGDKAEAISKIWKLKQECANDNWDDADASPIEWSTAISAQSFIRALPDDFPLPEFAAEPDGSISLDWIQSRHRLFSLSIGGSDRLAYAWLDGADKGHGVAQFDGTKVPSRILQGVQATVGENAAFRAS